jgi:hypothetical protein
MSGLRYVGTLHGGESRIGEFTVKASEVVYKGEMLMLTSNEAAKGTAGDATFIGIALENVDNTVDGHTVRCIIDPDAVYAYRDGTAHAAGATLDLAKGSSAGDALGASSSTDFVVIADNAATEDTLFIIIPGEHYLHTGG